MYTWMCVFVYVCCCVCGIWICIHLSLYYTYIHIYINNVFILACVISQISPPNYFFCACVRPHSQMRSLLSIHVYPHKLCEHRSESSREQVLLAQSAEIKPYSPPCANKNLCNRPRTCFVCTNAEYQVASNGYGMCMHSRIHLYIMYVYICIYVYQVASNGYGMCMRVCMHVCLCVCGRGGRGGLRVGQRWMWVWVLVWTWRSMCACILCVHMHIIICTYLGALFIHIYIHVSSFSGLHVLDTHECKQVRGHFLQKSPIIRGSFVKNDPQLKASYGSSPPCIWYIWKQTNDQTNQVRTIGEAQWSHE